MHYFKRVALLVALLVLVGIPAGMVFAAGNITSGQQYSQFLDKDLDLDGTKDFVNWSPTNGGATVSDSSVTGYIWGDNVGWINLGPFSSAGPTAGVKNTCTGDLSGFAWGQNTGWINFAPTNAVGANEPKINTSSGNITGTVWSQNYGWITLNSSNGTYPGLNTSWRPSPSCGTNPPPPPPQLDVCSNIAGLQATVPSGYYKVPPDPGVKGDCFPTNPTDLCTNIAGVQSVVPAGYTKVPALPGVPGICTSTNPPPADVCPNIAGVQSVVPNGYHLSSGQCVQDSNSSDVCPNLPGNQLAIPVGYEIDINGNCVQPTTDACPGIPGIQTSINDCPPPPPMDVCPNLQGNQASLPSGYHFDGQGNCIVGSCAAGDADCFEGSSSNSTTTIPVITDTLNFLKKNHVGWLLPLVGLLSSVPGLITRFGNLILTIAFKRKKMRGIVYDSYTKEPLDPAYVSVIDATTGQEVKSAITDMEGRYGFVLKKGTYKLVANKTHYKFPSEDLKGRFQDEVYDHLYFGEPFTIENEEEVVMKNIPMDPLEKDWNQREKRRRSPLKYLLENQQFWGAVLDVLFVLGFIFSVITTYYYPVWWNVLMVFIYIAVAVVQFFGYGPIAVGKITKAGMPVPFAIVRVMNASLNHEVAHKVTTEFGGYFVLVPKKVDYYITVEQRNPDGTYTKVFTSSMMHADQGVINKSFEI